MALEDKGGIWNVIFSLTDTAAGYISITLNRSKIKLKMTIFF
jgi:hypothetical protein